MKKILISCLSITLVLSGCSTTPVNKSGYTQEQEDKLHFCTAKADVAFNFAIKRNNGKSKAEAVKAYASIKDQTLINNIADEVYSANYDSPFVYQQQYFHQCGRKMAGVSQNKMMNANICNYVQFFSGLTYDFKDDGMSVKEINETFKTKPDSLLETVIQTAYSMEGTRSQVKTEMWNRCMKIDH